MVSWSLQGECFIPRLLRREVFFEMEWKHKREQIVLQSLFSLLATLSYGKSKKNERKEKKSYLQSSELVSEMFWWFGELDHELSGTQDILLSFKSFCIFTRSIDT